MDFRIHNQLKRMRDKVEEADYQSRFQSKMTEFLIIEE